MANALAAANRHKSKQNPKEHDGLNKMLRTVSLGIRNHGKHSAFGAKVGVSDAVAPDSLSWPEDQVVRASKTDAVAALWGSTRYGAAIDTSVWKYQQEANRLYEHIYSQIFVAVLIAGNFIANILEAQIAVNPGTARKEYQVFQAFEKFFFFIFWAELLLNMYSSWFWKFWNSRWNIFDFVVVVITTIDMIGLLDPDSPLGLLRMMRAFRVFRLFKRVKSLNKIVVSLGKAMPGVMNAFFILLLVMCIYAILGHQFFAHMPCSSDGGPYACNAMDRAAFDIDNDVPPPRMCKKKMSPGYGILQECRAQYNFGHEYFGNFLKSLYTLFQVLTGDSWSEAIGRPLLELHPVTALYFISFVLICAVVLINIVVAVLLEKMVEDAPEETNSQDDDDMCSEDLSTNGDGVSTTMPVHARSAVENSIIPSNDENVQKSEWSQTSRQDARLDAMLKQLEYMAVVIHALADKHGIEVGPTSSLSVTEPPEETETSPSNKKS